MELSSARGLTTLWQEATTASLKRRVIWSTANVIQAGGGMQLQELPSGICGWTAMH